jgi:hypothetical protein
MNTPLHLIFPLDVFSQSFAERCEEGQQRLSTASIAFVGLARNCAVRLAENLNRLERLVETCPAWKLHIETNDNIDDTDQVLIHFCAAYPQATFTSQTLGRQQFSAEFAGPRTIALAEYRDACQRWVRDNAADCDYVVAIDWDAWGGWSHAGVLNGLGWLVQLQGAYGMASVSLLEHPQLTTDDQNKPTLSKGWSHYDAWALRLNSTWDDYTAGMGGWKHQWLPPVGSPPVKVCSAFGGLTIYRTEAYLKGTYDGTTDCEHVAFHDSIERATGQHLYLNPSQRCVMSWMSDEGQHGDD